MTIYDDKPWLSQYDAGQPHEIAPAFRDVLSIFRRAVAHAPDRSAIRYFDAVIDYSELDTLSDAFAVALAARGFGAGDRLAIYLQNVPQFVIAQLAAWKLGGVAVPVNPMNRARELRLILDDSGARALVCHESLYRDVVRDLMIGPEPPNLPLIVTTSELEFQTRNDPRLFAKAERLRDPGTEDLLGLIERVRGQKPPMRTPKGDDLAMLVYTSGTTGVPKGAMNIHSAVAFNAQVYRDLIELHDGCAILGVAPLFHITGLVGHIGASFMAAGTLILSYRFEPGVMLEAIREHRAEFTIGSITVFIALMNHPDSTREHFASLTKIYSGGAPIPPSVIEEFRGRFGHYIHNGYGLTETNSPTHVVPLRSEAPIDPKSGTLAIGVPVFNVSACIADDEGRPVPLGEIGEILMRGPMIVPGYWNKAEETAKAMAGGWFHSGDVGFMDAAGWFYLVDRKKDMINAGGYKVWPREVEDVLYSHPAIREAAVVGMPDAYRGETVKAVISVKPAMTVQPDEVIAFCRERMAAYKVPRVVVVIDELPKTVTGKILRRELR